MVAAGTALVALGVGLLGVGALAWSGRWRGWSRRFATVQVSPIALQPALGCFCLVTGLGMLGAVTTSSPLAVVLALAGCALFIINVWQPAWYGPRWLRRQRAAGPVEPDVNDALTALTHAAVSPRLGPRGSAAQVWQRFENQEPLARWYAKWVFGNEDGPRVNRLLRPGVAQGRLTLFPDGLAFGANDFEDRSRARAVVMSWPREDVLGARAVPRRASPDGRRRRGPLLSRCGFSRLVVDTKDGAYLFEVLRAGAKARCIAQALDAVGTTR